VNTRLIDSHKLTETPDGVHLLGVCESELTLVYWTGAFFILTRAN
jgi:hypothetical protein